MALRVVEQLVQGDAEELGVHWYRDRLLGGESDRLPADPIPCAIYCLPGHGPQVGVHECGHQVP